MKAKFRGVIALIGLIFILASCGCGNSVSSPESNTETEKTDKTTATDQLIFQELSPDEENLLGMLANDVYVFSCRSKDRISISVEVFHFGELEDSLTPVVSGANEFTDDKIIMVAMQNNGMTVSIRTGLQVTSIADNSDVFSKHLNAKYLNQVELSKKGPVPFIVMATESDEVLRYPDYYDDDTDISKFEFFVRFSVNCQQMQ